MNNAGDAYMKKKIRNTLFLSFVLLGATALTEFLFYRQDENTWVRNFHDRLHQQELLADEILDACRDTISFVRGGWNEDLIGVCFQNGGLKGWTHKKAGGEHLYRLPAENRRFVRIGNTFYEVRRKTQDEWDWFALLKIKDVYPYTTRYVKNSFGKFLKISEENVDELAVLDSYTDKAHLIENRDGEPLFYLLYGENYKEHGSNYLMITLYLLFFLSLFYVYDLLQKNAPTLKLQLYLFFGFILFLLGMRYFMLHFHLPPSIYQLLVFDENISNGIYIRSIGDLILTTFCIFQLVYTTLSDIRINYENESFKRYRYVWAVISLLIVFLYVRFFNFSVDSVIENMDIHLNVAKLVHIGMDSIIAFVSICLAGLVILALIFGIVSVFQRFFSFRQVFRISTSVCFALWIVSEVSGIYTNFRDCFFIWSSILLIAINKYLLKKDIQRSIYILVIFLLSIYMVMVTKKCESYMEYRQRINYATELIEERDYNFEERLKEIDRSVSLSDELKGLMDRNEEHEAEEFLRGDLLNMTGYNYYPDITFCRLEDSLLLTDMKEQLGCREYFEQIISEYGHAVGSTHFYSIGIFDGFTTYIGRFAYGDTYLYLRFDASKDNEGLGYPQVLSHKAENEKDRVYLYSYAKYTDGELVSSSGNFVYYRKLGDFGKNERDGVILTDKDHYSHMIIPVNEKDTLIVSLPENTFALYYMNALYAFFVCIIISSYGLFFNVNRNLNFRKGTLKARIKNNIISLIFVLFVLLTALSIYINTKSFEKRHNAKAMELLKYVNKELERLDCVDPRLCPDILTTLSEMSELLMIDINIYSYKGELVSTSRPEIFRIGFDGWLINPKALEQIEIKGATSYIEKEKIGGLGYISAYMPLIPDNGKSYILNVPYFAQNDELNLDIIIMIVITVNIAVVMMVLAFILSGLIAEKVTKPLQMVNEKLRKMRIGGKNEKIRYGHKDEVGVLVQAYNDMVDKLDESIEQLARSERENAWREMAHQIAHEIKNPLTPMKLNIQFMLRSLQMENPEKFKQRFRNISGMLIEQIDNLAAIASAFSDFAKLSVTNNEIVSIDNLVRNCTLLFENDVDEIICDANTGLKIFADKEQMRRVIINLLKNAEQSIPGDRNGKIEVKVLKNNGKVEIRIRDNGSGIPEELQKRIFEPNFTTKSSGSGLGLAICQRIIEGLGGKIGFMTTLGEGSEFYIILNYCED